MRIGIIRYPGSNCDIETFKYFNDELATSCFYIWHTCEDLSILDKIDLLVIPGGFAFGDRIYNKATDEYTISAGEMASKSPVNILIRAAFKDKNIAILGICNGFQILTETGLLPGVLLQNKYQKFICKNVYLKINNKENRYFKNIKKEILELHIAHNEGNYFCSEDELKSLNDNNQVAVTYCNENGEEAEDSNPNGALKNIAGIFSKNKNILGMMPHPERMIDKYLSGSDGSFFFENLIENLK